VTFILRRDDNPAGASTYLHPHNSASRDLTGALPVEVNMKLLLAALLLCFSAGCGGYGSGMGTTPAPAPQISPVGGMYATPLTVTISDSLQNAVIYVTTDGSTPTLSSPVYRGPFALTQPGTVQVKALVGAGGYATSAVTVANFTLQ
jgi:hypothetical protein